ncbi:hypothetical protein BGZ60DRAFT_402691 [Tricladium varicosporioides]|nr:hypothetical protein BGZ60DRAFT_402691 [Hymenoscyphus varicosporioides]
MTTPTGLANMPRVRTRHGCWTCRKRRRKCDEKKPRCQNCIDKDYSCQYGLQLTFLEANMLTLMSHEANDLKKRIPERYHSLRFVDGFDESHDSPEPLGAEGDETRSSPLRISRHGDQNSCVGTRNIFLRALPDSTDPDTSFIEDDRNVFEDDFLDLEVQEHTTTSKQVSSLGTTPGATSLNLLGGYQSECPQSVTRSRSWDQSPGSTQTHTHGNSGYGDGGENIYLSQELLKTFIDGVLPWLELSSPGSPHSGFLPLLSSQYQPLRLAILALATHQPCNPMHREFSSQVTERALNSLSPNLQNYNTETIATRKLLLIAQLLPREFSVWRSILSDGAGVINDVGSHESMQENHEPVTWALLRFDLALSLASQLPPITNLDRWQHIEKTGSGNPGSPSSAAPFLENSLLLCVHTVKLYFSTSSHESPNTKIWMSLYSRQQTIQSNQPTEFIPLLISAIGSVRHSDVDSSKPRHFPLSIHTTRLSLYTAFLGHLTSLLLIQCRPRRLNQAVVRKMKTETWHALQICSLSLSNKLLWSWDPVIIAALLHCGRLLSYSAQQEELIEHLRKLQLTTGWEFQAAIGELEGYLRECYE